MDLFDFGFFRGLVGLDRGHREAYAPQHSGVGDDEWREGEEGEARVEEDDSNQNFFQFRVLTDPLEIHKFFEKEMEQMFKEFGGIGGIMGQRKMLEDFPSRLEELPIIPESGGQTDRDLMLKPESEMVSPGFGRDRRIEDQDLDEQNITSEHLDKLFKNPNHKTEIQSKRDFPSLQDEDRLHGQDGGNHWGGVFSSPGSGFNSYSLSKSIRTVQMPDGSIETEERTRNPDGSESVIIKRRVGDREETINQDGTLVPYSGGGGAGGCLPLDPFQHQPHLPQMFGHMFSGMLGGGHQYHPGREGQQPHSSRDDLLPPGVAPPSDRLFTTLFSQFFGDQRR
jgi:hypothetical protein